MQNGWAPAVKRKVDLHLIYQVAEAYQTGIVTNDGGVLCHAMVLARELQKPCVIATRIATEVFKDGDMVEVDAERGIVRKI